MVSVVLSHSNRIRIARSTALFAWAGSFVQESNKFLPRSTLIDEKVELSLDGVGVFGQADTLRTQEVCKWLRMFRPGEQGMSFHGFNRNDVLDLSLSP